MGKNNALKKKLLVLNPFPVYPPTSGGQERVFYLYKHVAEYYNVTILCFADRRGNKEIAPGLMQITIPKSRTHIMEELKLSSAFGIYTCATTPMVSRYTPEYAHILYSHKNNATAIVLSHPYLYDEVKRLNVTVPIIYDAHNVEIKLHREILPVNTPQLLNEISRVEQAACQDSQLIITCSQQDANALAALYNVDPSKLKVVPNGADITKNLFSARISNANNKLSQGLEQPLALFIGSYHIPNINAAQHILNMAPKLPNIKFKLLGSLCRGFHRRQLPANVEMPGIVTEHEINKMLCTADVALNPILSGSGTNIKMLDYMAAGIPIITTKYGARGIGGGDGKHFLIEQPTEMPARLLELICDKAKATYLASNAYCLVKKHFDWRQIATSLVSKLDKLTN